MGGGGRTVTTFEDEVIGVEVETIALPTIRSREVRFRAFGLMPNTRHFPFFDGVRVDRYCFPLDFDVANTGDNWRWGNRNNWDANDRVTGELALTDDWDSRFRTPTQIGWENRWHPLYGDAGPNDPASPTYTGALVSDQFGVIEGSFFIPNNDEISFPAGARIFSLYDITVEDDDASASRAKSEYFAQGIRETTNTLIRRTERRRRIDPIAQTFFVDNDEGVFITKVSLFFQSKDAGNLPVIFQMRPTENGYPSATEVIPGTELYLTPDDITVSADASVATNVVLPKPTYLAPGGEYAIVLLTQSFDYNVWISRLGDFPIGETDRKITTQPSLGSLFKSQNSTTWEPSQLEDLKFTLHRAKFVTSGSAIFENEEPSRRLLPNNPFLFDSGDATVRVIHPNHGHFVNDSIRLVIDSDATLPVNASSISGSRTITAIDATGYTFEADSNATSGGRFGGTKIKAPDQVLMDYMIPSINSNLTTYNTLTFDGKFTTGKSLAGTETPYGKDASFSDPFEPFERKFFPTPRLIATKLNEDNEIGGSSTTIRATMATTNDFVSPVINVDRASITAISNVIDRQDSAATSGYNVPLTFVPETDPTLGSAVAKHITVPVTLAEDATGLKILLSANKPSEAFFDVYYKAITEDQNLGEVNWSLVEPETPLVTDANPSVYREYQYLVGGLTGTMDAFTIFQIKIVMHSTNSSHPPSFRDLRVLALTT